VGIHRAPSDKPANSREQSTLKELLAQFLRRPFVRKVGTVATGTAVSQAIALAFAPLITRLYGPEAFGLQSIFVSVVGLISIVATLGYPLGIVLPKTDSEAMALVRLSVATGTVATLLTAICLYFFGSDLLSLLNAQVIERYAYLIPVAVYAAVLARVLAQWLVRNEAFSLSAKYGVITAFAMSAVKATLGLHWPTPGVLICANTAVGLAGTGCTYWGWLRQRHLTRQKEPRQRAGLSLLNVAIKHRDFALLRTPQDLINALSQALPLLLLSAYFGSTAAGHYAIAIAVLGVPTALIGSSVMAVFYPRVTQAVQDGEDARSLIVRATSGMALAGAAPFLVLVIAGPVLFSWVFGDDWRTAGVYAQCLAPWLFMQFINQPAVAAVPALRIQRGLLIYEIFSTATKVLALWLGFSIFGNDLAAVVLFSAFGVVAYAWLIGWVISVSRKDRYPN